MAGIRAWADETDINRIEMGDAEVGIVACGAAYQFAREAFPQASFLKVGMSYPLPEKLVREFRSKVRRLYVVEELDPFLEEQIPLCVPAVDIAVSSPYSRASRCSWPATLVATPWAFSPPSTPCTPISAWGPESPPPTASRRPWAKQPTKGKTARSPSSATPPSSTPA